MPYMRRSNIEIKTQCLDPEHTRKVLRENDALLLGIDNQVDTYFQVPKGKLKLRESSLPYEYGLIHYDREIKSGPKISQITVFQTPNDEILKQVLTKSLNILVVVKKRRELYLIDNVKFHLDVVESLGNFLEIEAQDTHGLLGKTTLTKQCHYYLDLLKIKRKDLLVKSYSDLVLQNQKAVKSAKAPKP
jgi:adenylate cyclase class IV